ncbi:MAG: rhodanese-like domain-containing protein [Desertimonas sp.]
MTPRPSLDVVEAAERITAGVVVIDVRQPDEYADGHIEGAALIPLGELPDRLAEVPIGEAVIVVCRSGNRSGAATDLLVGAGRGAWNLAGGMIAWSAADLPTTV